MTTVLVATTNPGKLKEYREMLGGMPIQWKSLADVGLNHVDVEETGATFLDNALIKALAYCRMSGLPTLADDSGLSVDALQGAPGVYSARYAPTAAERIVKLLNALDAIPDDQRGAHFICVTAFATPNGITLTAEGRVDGKIGYEPRGTHGFGFDPVFVMEGGKTMAELLPDEKHKISHRGRALAKLAPLLRHALTE